jgi:hypothetical protein
LVLLLLLLPWQLLLLASAPGLAVRRWLLLLM